MPKPKLHLDADASQRALQEALLKRGHDITWTPQPDLPLDASDDFQLLWSTAQGRIIFSFNIRDFIHKTSAFPKHYGILLAHHSKYSLTDLIYLIDKVLNSTNSDEWIGQVRWLSDWRDQ
jgi:hypothetical protein